MEEVVFPLATTFKKEFDQQLNKLKLLVNHGPSLGRYVEILFLDLLNKYFPKKYDFSTGFYYSQNPKCGKKSSKQIDIICFDRFNFPVLFDDNEIVVVSTKSVKSLIEIKSCIDKSSIKQVLEQSYSEASMDLPLTVKFNLLGTRSTLSPQAVCKYIIEYYKEHEVVVRALGVIYSLSWEDIIVFDTRNKKYEVFILNNFNYGISTFINNLLFDIYGLETYLSAANSIGSSLFIPKESFIIRDDKPQDNNNDDTRRDLAEDKEDEPAR